MAAPRACCLLLSYRLVFGSVFDWPDVLGVSTWLFDQGSTFGYRPEPLGESTALRGPAPDWSLGDSRVPLMHFQGHWANPVNATSYPGSILFASESEGLRFRAHLIFDSANLSLVKLTLENSGKQTAHGQFSIGGSGANISAQPGEEINFGLPNSSMPCFAPSLYGRGRLVLIQSVLLKDELQPLSWNVTDSKEHFEATSLQIDISPAAMATAFILVTPVASVPDRMDFRDLSDRFRRSIWRWEGYLQAVKAQLPARKSQLDKDAIVAWSAVKSVMTLLGNWRTVPGLPSGVLPSYIGYEGGFWSWDTYKQAVGMVHFAPDLAKDQLRLLVSARDATGHIPDKVDRCGHGGGCSGKPPLLGWAVWTVFQQTQDLAFLHEMYSIVSNFHHFWYKHRDVTGAGLCSWTEGMESGMDDGVRFQPEFARSVANTTSHVTTLDFWSVDLNSYLFKEKKLLSQMAALLAYSDDAREWEQDAEALLPKLQNTFFVPDGDRAGFFSDVYFNGSALPIKGCEGFAALFSGVATYSQALRMANTLWDSNQFFLNFSLPTVSKNNRFFNAQGYWKGPTWIDQTWFAYTGLRSFARIKGNGSSVFAGLASELKQRIFRGFVSNDTTPLHEHYHPETGAPQGVPHFSWTAAHLLMWVDEGNKTSSALVNEDDVTWI